MKIIEPSTNDEWEKYFDLRYRILRKPWGQPESSTKDGEEDISLHFLMVDDNNEAIGTGRLQLNSNDEGQIRSMAVRDDQQGKGLGKQIVKVIEEKAKEKKLRYIILDARINAVKFYEGLGYKVIGDSYLLFGVIPHFRMKKEI